MALLSSAGVMRYGPEAVGLGPDGDPPRSPAGRRGDGDGRRWRREALGTWRFWSVSAPFALGLAAQVGVLTHLVSVTMAALGPGNGARVVSATTAAALVGRVAAGLVVDRLNRRAVAGVTLITQRVGRG